MVSFLRQGVLFRLGVVSRGGARGGVRVENQRGGHADRDGEEEEVGAAVQVFIRVHVCCAKCGVCVWTLCDKLDQGVLQMCQGGMEGWFG